MPDVEGTEYLTFEEFKNTVIDMLNALGTNHIRIRLLDGGELDFDYAFLLEINKKVDEEIKRRLTFNDNSEV